MKHAYPIVKEIVKNHLGLDVHNLSQCTNASESKDKSISIEKNLSEKMDNFQEEIRKILDNFSTIPKDNNHPISVLLDRIREYASKCN